MPRAPLEKDRSPCVRVSSRRPPSASKTPRQDIDNGRRMNAGHLHMTLTIFLVVAVLQGTVSGQSGPNWAFQRQSWPDADIANSEKKKSGEEVLGSLLSEEKPLTEECFGKQCVHHDQCCPGFLCVDVGGMGTCLPVFGQREGEACRQDSDCEEGMRCTDNPNLPLPRTCLKVGAPRPRDVKKKIYNDECLTSAECDVSKGLCCQVQRRHRQAPRKVCYYFADPRSCIGRVDPTQAKPMSFGFNPFFKARVG